MGESSRITIKSASHFSFPRIFFFWLTAIGASIYGVYSAIQLQWLCDDIYITLRYVENILAGNGWVYNIGERVEGYTHFLWLCVITFFQWLGANPEITVKTVGIIAYGATLLVFSLITYSRWDRRSLIIPLTTIVLSVHYDFKIWSSSGLETMLFTFFIAASFYFFYFWKAELPYRLFATGLGATLVILTRPDGALFFFILSFFIAAFLWKERASRKEFFQNMVMYISPFIIVYLPYMVWKISYYGHFFPNTYYAKSGDLIYWPQGFYYIWTYLQSYPSSTFFILAVIPLYLWWRRLEKKSIIERFLIIVSDRSIAPLMFSLAFILFYSIVFVAKVGGDFMFARFLIPLIPFAYFLLESTIHQLSRISHRVSFILLLIIPLMVVYEKSRRDTLFFSSDGRVKDPLTNTRGIIDEYWYWTHDNGDGRNILETQSQTGKILAEFFRGVPVKVLLKAQASLGYYGQFYQAIDDCGLTDETIAHLTLEKRGRPGHEKIAPLEYVERAHVDFLFQRTTENIPSYRKATFHAGDQTIHAALLTYNSQLLTTLKDRFPNNFSYTNFEEYLDNYVSDAPTKTKAELERDYKRFRGFYFMHTNDKNRENKFRRLLEMPTID